MFQPEQFLDAVIRQDAAALRAFFCEDACVEWVCTNERFTAEEYLRANCEYPGSWRGEMEKSVAVPNGIIMAARIWTEEKNASFHVVGFAELRGGKIVMLQEYWSDDGPAPEWRQKLKIGRPIK